MNIRNYAILLSVMAITSPQLSTHVLAQATTNTATAAQTQSAYDKAMAAAKNILEVQKWTGERSKEKRNKSAAIEYEKAGDNAPDDAKKYEAYMKAGEYYDLARSENNVAVAMNQYDIDLQLRQSPFRVYEKATKVASLTGEQKAKAQVKLADAERIRNWVSVYSARGLPLAEKQRLGDKVRALYTAVLEIPGADKASRIHAQNHIGYVWQQQGEYLKAAQAMETLSKWPGLSNNEQLDALSNAIYVLTDGQKAQPNPAVAQFLDQVYPRIVKLETKPENVIMRHMHWGDWLLAYGNAARAYAVWEAMADDAKASTEARLSAIERIAQQRGVEKQAALGIKAWERTNTWPAPKAHEPNWMFRRAVSLATMHEASGDEGAFRAELTTAAALTGIANAQRAFVSLHIGASHHREIATLKKAPASTQNTAQIATHETAAKAAYEKVIATKDAEPADRYDAVINRAKFDSEQKEYNKALHWIVTVSDEFSATASVADDAYILPLAKAAAKVYSPQKKYSDAVVVLAAGLRKHGKEDKEATDMIQRLYSHTFANKLWDQCRAMLTTLGAIGLGPAQFNLETLKIEAGAENWRAAAEIAVIIEKLNLYMLGAEDVKEFNAVKAKIPTDVLKAAQAANAPKPAAPPATSNDDDDYGFFWF